MPLRTGLYGASAAVAVGAVAMASGLLPGPDGLPGSDQSGRVRADGPAAPPSQAIPSSLPSSSPGSHGHGGDGDGKDKSDGKKKDGNGKHRGSPSPDPSPSDSHHSGTGKHGKGRTPDTGDSGAGNGGGSQGHSPGTPSAPDSIPGGKPKSSPAPSSPDSSGSGMSATERQVLSLVNQERGKAGCPAVTADSQLADLAGDFSTQMDEQHFFSHTAPNGDTPWDRAKAADVPGLGGENIARGQTDAHSVMQSWMTSPGHRANILNCDYHKLGVGAHFGPGGPWWTQDFGF